VWIVLILALGQPLAAQSSGTLPSKPVATWAPAVVIDRQTLDEAAIDKWIQDYTRWREWADKWTNRRQWVTHPFPYPFWKESPEMFAYVAARRVEPQPPIGLEAACVSTPRSSGNRSRRVQACELLTVWKDDYATQQIRWAVATARAQKDDVSRSRFLEHIHFASLWSSVQGVGGGRAYGLAGIHATIDVKGRWQIYALPGVMAISVPNSRGQRVVTVGYDWGMAVRLGSLRVPLAGVPVKVHLNLAKVWMPEVGQRLDMIGLSFSPNPNR
jgi:hypothetical protein